MNTIRLFVHLFLFCGMSMQCLHGYSQTRSKGDLTDSLQENFKLKQEQSFKQIMDSLRLYQARHDTGKVILALLDLGDVERFRGNHSESFDRLWEALLLAEETEQELRLVNIHRNLGIMYDIYKQDSLALRHLKISLGLSKRWVSERKIHESQSVSCYFSLAGYWRDRGVFDIALNYLDSCELIYNDGRFLPSVVADRGFLYIKIGELSKAEVCLHQAEKFFRDTNNPYHIAVLSFLGDLKNEQQMFDSAMVYYKQSLDEIGRRNAHIEFRPEILHKLSKLYLNKGQVRKAYRHLNASKISSDSLFNATKGHNQRLFGIKNKYKESLAEKEHFIHQQELVIARKNKLQLWLIMLVGFVVLAGITFYLYLRQKDKVKKIELISKLEQEKNKTVLEVKSKELTAYTLQLIEKEQSLNALLQTIKEKIPAQYNILKNRHSNASKSMWDDFNRRFIELNNDFYPILREKHPDLSSTEQKHCALIKLNFSSNEMAHLLNISLQSVHTSRYRIRKKIGLEHEASLEEYIDGL